MGGELLAGGERASEEPIGRLTGRSEVLDLVSCSLVFPELWADPQLLDLYARGKTYQPAETMRYSTYRG